MIYKFYFLFLLILINQALSSPKVMVFGVFDLFHPGHQSFLNQAKSYGDLYVVVTRDAIVKKLKNKKPLQDELARQSVLEKCGNARRVLLGDEVLGTYTVIKEIMPDLICLGYDQQGLERDLQRVMKQGMLPCIPLIILKPFMPERYHTSLLREKLEL